MHSISSGLSLICKLDDLKYGSGYTQAVFNNHMIIHGLANSCSSELLIPGPEDRFILSLTAVILFGILYCVCKAALASAFYLMTLHGDSLSVGH